MVLSSSSLVFSSPLTLDLSAGLISQLFFFPFFFIFTCGNVWISHISSSCPSGTCAENIKEKKGEYLSGKSKVLHTHTQKSFFFFSPPQKKISFSQQGLKASDTLQSLSGDEQPEAKEQTAEATPNEIGYLPGAKEKNKSREERNVRFVTSSKGGGDVAAEEEDGQAGEEVRDLRNKKDEKYGYIN